METIQAWQAVFKGMQQTLCSQSDFYQLTLTFTLHYVLVKSKLIFAFLPSLIFDVREQLVVSCVLCDDLKLLDLLTAFTGFKPDALCPTGQYSFNYGGTDQLYSWTLLVLYLKLYSDITCIEMCYIPPPVGALVLSDAFSFKMVALSIESGALIWEFQYERTVMC